MVVPIRRRAARLEWERLATWLLVQILAFIAMNLLKTTRFLYRRHLLALAIAEQGFRISAALVGLADRVYRGYMAKRSALAAEARAFRIVI
jgi:hypothetical protein